MQKNNVFSDTNNMNYGNIKVAFDCEKYKNKQKEQLLNKCKEDKNSILYIEVGGKIINDFHSARVLPGYRADLKLEFINELFPNAEFICCISAKDLERQRERGDFSLSYDKEIIRLINELKERGKIITKIAITRIDKNNENKSVLEFEKNTKKLGFEVIKFYENDNYKPNKKVVKGLAENPYIESNAKQIVVIAPGAGSGKFGICLNQIYHEMEKGRIPQYVKIETFPVFNLPIDHLVNQAYAAATADFGDKVMPDKNSSNSTSYNRDIDNFKLLQFIATLFDEKISKYIRAYNSPTSMGVNCIKDGIIDDATVQRESAAEIGRRFIRGYQDYLSKKEKKETVLTLKKILNNVSNIVK